MAQVSFFIVLAWLPGMTRQTSVLAPRVCLSVLLHSLRTSAEQERATEGSEIIATLDVTREAVSELREEIQTGTEEKAGRRQRRCTLFGGARVNVCALAGQWARRQLLAATAWTSPAPGHTSGCMKGWSKRSRLGDKRMHTSGETTFHQFFCPLSNLLSFSV